MTVDRDLGLLPEALASLVAAERRAPDASAADRARVWSAIAPMLPPPGGGSNDPSGSGDAGPSGGHSSAAPAKGAALAKSALPWIGLVAAIGGISILIATRTQDAAPRPAPPAVEIAPAPAAPPRVVTPPTPPAKPWPHATSKPPTSEDAVTEDVLIERARISLARARFEEALALLTQHEKQFPTGSMRGERELLIVRALLGTSNRAGAEQRAERLHRNDPNNPSLPAIDAALAK